MFVRYCLRTTDLDPARRFYAEAIGLEIPEGRRVGDLLEGWPLHEQARARGAPAHWLGHVAVEDVEAAAARLVAEGGERLGPVVSADGVSWTVVRDPFGVVVGVRERGEALPASPVVWHQAHVRDLDRAWATYAALFGWADAGVIEAPDLEGGLQRFAWAEGGPAVGAVANTARRPGVHTHWLLHFPVDDLDGALERVRALGGKVIGPAELPGLGRVAACDDPQGAAFGLVEARRAI